MPGPSSPAQPPQQPGTAAHERRGGPPLGGLRRRVPAPLKQRWWRLRDALRARALVLRAGHARREPGRGRLASEEARATRALAARLQPQDAAALEAALAASDLSETALWAAAEGVERTRLGLILGVGLGVPGVCERTGLEPRVPPGDVHHMASGPLAVAGSLYHADLVADALAGSGAPLAPGARVLDFGCSSGRVVRVLAAAFPDVHWHGCDPNPGAIGWARDALAGVEFATSAEGPPLPYGDERFDAAFAISIWSHFDAPAAEAWLAELHRVLRPGGRLALTVHGRDALAYYARRVERSRLKLERARLGLEEHDFAFDPIFAGRGDSGLRSAHWGEAYLTAEWLAARLAPRWSLLDFAAGRNEGNQDVYVLGRR